MGTPKSVRNRQQQITEEQLKIGRDTAAKQQQLFASLIGPALKGEAPSYFLNAILPQLEQGFQQSGENLAGFLGKSGQGTSGIAASPYAHLQIDQANSMSDARNQSILQALQYGFQGNQVYNPQGAFSGAGNSNAQLAQMSQNPWLGVLGGIASSAIGAFNPLGRLTGMAGMAGGGGGGFSSAANPMAAAAGTGNPFAQANYGFGTLPSTNFWGAR